MAARPRPLATAFFARDTLSVARDLVGCILWTETDGERTAGRLVEVEAYLGTDDPASHAGRGPTPRSAIMFGPPGRAYVYLSYGVHHCLNAVTEAEGTAGAVLLRAIEPLVGEAAMRRRRGPAARSARALASGPGRLCQALGVDRRWNGVALAGRAAANGATGRRVWIAASERAPTRLVAAPRIGIRRAVGRPFRFCDAASPYLSAPLPAGTRTVF